MPSATTAESSDSMAPSIAMAKAGGEQLAEQIERQPERLPSPPGRCQGRTGSGGSCGMPLEDLPADLIAEAAADGRDGVKPGTKWVSTAAATPARPRGHQRRRYLRG